MSGFLFLLIIDWIMRRVTTGQRMGLRWNFTTTLEDLDFADDIALLSSRFSDLKKKTTGVEREAGRVGLKLSPLKCKTLRTKHAKSSEKVLLDGKEVEDCDEFIYLGATVDKEGGGDKDIANRLKKGRGVFKSLWRVWSVRGIGRRTKLKLFDSLVKPVLLYGCETWKITIKAAEKKLDTFQSRCLRSILVGENVK